VPVESQHLGGWEMTLDTRKVTAIKKGIMPLSLSSELTFLGQLLQMRQALLTDLR
jgi:hypothetical protein